MACIYLFMYISIRLLLAVNMCKCYRFLYLPIGIKPLWFRPYFWVMVDGIYWNPNNSALWDTYAIDNHITVVSTLTVCPKIQK